jgi:acetylornithine/N-succinyldiaminopimelate aminotransferase
MEKQTVIDMEQEYVLGVYGRPPFVLERGQGSTLYDSDGKAYLDCVAGIAVNALGYNDAGVNQAIVDGTQSGVLHVSNLYHSEPHARLAKVLCETSFADRVHFCNSGAEANEGAFKFARRYAREKGHEDKFEILAFSNAFHGRLYGALAATPRPKYQDPFKPLMPGVRFAEFNDLASARDQMNENVCAIIVEPVQGEGGLHVATHEFLAGLRQLADEFDALLIFDEVQCGVGRTGTFWAYEGYRANGHDRAGYSDRRQTLGRGSAHRGDSHAPKSGRRYAQGRSWQHLCRRSARDPCGPSRSEPHLPIRIPEAGAGQRQIVARVAR